MKHNNFGLKRLVPPLLLLSLLLTGVGCGNKTETPQTGDAQPQYTLDDKSITDKKEYYSDLSNEVVTMYLTVRTGSEADHANHTWEELNSHSTYYYAENNLSPFKVEGLLQVGDETGPLPDKLGYAVTTPNALVSVRGKTTSRAPQKSFKIKLNKGKGSWNEQRTIILNKHIYDATRFRNKLSYDLMAEYEELIGAKTTFVHLYVKDLTASGTDSEFSDYGLYTQVEQINTRYLENHGLDPNAQLYKATMFEFQTYDAIKLTGDEGYDQSAFEEVLEIKGNDDHSKLIEMLNAVNNYAVPIEETFKKYFDEENYFSWLAFQLMIGNTDITSQNFYLYSPLNGNKWYFISWDNDGAWSYQSRAKNYAEQGYNYTDGVSNLWGAILHQRVLKSETLRNKLMEKIKYYYGELSKQSVQQKIKGYAEVVYPYVFRMPDTEYAPLKANTYASYVDGMMTEVEQNYQMILESLAHPMPFYANDPQPNGSGLIYAWEDSYNFDGGDITYTVEVATDYYFKNIVFSKDSSITQTEGQMLSDGKYFMRVTAKNAAGKTQTMQYQYEDPDGKKHFGISEFYVDKGQITGALNG